jgi:hypothetical protein
MGPRAVLDAVVKRKVSSPRRESNPRTPIVQLVAQFLILSSHLHLDKPNAFSLQIFDRNSVCISHLPAHATCTVTLILLDLITAAIFGCNTHTAFPVNVVQTTVLSES